MEFENMLRELGTISLTYECMKQRIKFGNIPIETVTPEGNTPDALYAPPTALNLSLWITFIPLPFREKAIEVMTEIAEGFYRHPCNNQTLELIISEFQARVSRDYHNGKLTIHGWKG